MSSIFAANASAELSRALGANANIEGCRCARARNSLVPLPNCDCHAHTLLLRRCPSSRCAILIVRIMRLPWQSMPLAAAEVRRASRSRGWRPSRIMYEFGRSSGSRTKSAAANARLAACRWPRERPCCQAVVVSVAQAAGGAADGLAEQRGGVFSSRWAGQGRLLSVAACRGRRWQRERGARDGRYTRTNTTAC